MAILHYLMAISAVIGPAAGVTIPIPTPTQTLHERASNPTPTPFLQPAIGNCEVWHWVNPGETCDSVVNLVGINILDFAKLNPALGPDAVYCPGALAAFNWVCIGAAGRNDRDESVPPAEPELNPVIDGFWKSWLEKAKTAKPSPPAPKPTKVTTTKALPPCTWTTSYPKPMWDGQYEPKGKCLWLGQDCPPFEYNTFYKPLQCNPT